MILRKGDKVVFLNEVGGGVVDSVSDDGRIGVLDGDGFVRYYSSNEIAPVHHEDYNSHKIHHKDIQDKPVKKVNVELNSTGQVEIDLHIDQLISSSAGMSNHDIVLYQMRVLKRFIEDAMQKKVRKVLVIHGVGEGKLRSEVHAYLRGIDGALFHDANYTPKGFGATLLELRYR